jgi:hypothetical protein
MKHTEPLKLDIELYFTGELSGEEASSLESHLRQCPVCHDYLQTLRRERNEFLADHPFSALNIKTEESESPWYQRLFDALTRPALFPVYGLLLIIAVTVPVFLFGNRGQINDEIRFKGTSGLTFLYQRDGVVEEGDKRKAYRAGDRIQILYNSTKEQYAALLSIDSKGQFHFITPQHSDHCTVKSPAGSALTFPGSIILDDSKGSELIILLLSDKPLPVKTVSSWISELHEKFPQVSELEKVVVKEKLKTVSQIFTLLLHKE